MLGLTPPMWAALHEAPLQWTRIREPFHHARATLDALDARHFIHHRLDDYAFFEWRVTSTGKQLREAERKVMA